MKVWMLTGDKVETATCIAISTGLKSQNHRLFFIRDNPDIDYIRKCLLEFKQMNDSILIIDGDCLESCLKYLEPLFFEVSLKVKLKHIYRLLQSSVADVALLRKQSL